MLGYVPARTERKQYSILAFNFGTFGRAFSWDLPAGRQAAADQRYESAVALAKADVDEDMF